MPGVGQFMYNTRNRGNGLDLLSSLQDGCVSAVIFDPQYRGVLDHLQYGNEGVRESKRISLQQMTDADIQTFMKEFDRVVHLAGHVLLWIDKFHLATGIQPWIDGTDLHQVDLICWDKCRMGMGYRSRSSCEYLMILQKSPTRARGIWTDRGIRDVWSEKIAEPQRRLHPHAKPVGLQARLIECITKPGDIIVDPCAGSFSSLDAVNRVAKTSGTRVYWGTDLNG